MGVHLPATITCDACGVRAEAWMVVTKLTPAVAMHVSLPDGWSARTKEFSGELFILCKDCAPMKLSLPTPIILTPEELEAVRAKLPKKK